MNSCVHRHILRYPEQIVLCKEIISYKCSFTHITRNWLHGFVMSAFSQIAAAGLRKHCKTAHIQCTENFAVPHIHKLVQKKKFSPDSIHIKITQKKNPK